MTKEKLAIKLAIDIMERNVSKYINHGIYEVSDTDGAVHVEFAEAINILNEMLEQEPCEDAVSREDALDILEDYDYDRDRHKENAFADARARMVALPSVTPIRPKGEWIDFAVEPEKIFNQHYYACPHCDHGATYFVGGTENWWCTETPNFCPHCGADMRGEKDAT